MSINSSGLTTIIDSIVMNWELILIIPTLILTPIAIVLMLLSLRQLSKIHIIGWNALHIFRLSWLIKHRLPGVREQALKRLQECFPNEMPRNYDHGVTRDMGEDQMPQNFPFKEVFSGMNQPVDFYNISQENIRGMKPELRQAPAPVNPLYTEFFENHCVKFQYQEDTDGYYAQTENLDTIDENIIFIVGDVGCGKSTLLTKHCYIKSREATPDIDINLLIDEPNSNQRDVETEHFLCSKIVDSLKRSIHVQTLEKHRITPSLGLTRLLNNLSSLFQGRCITFYIDNLDMIYDDSALMLLSSPDHQDEFREWFNGHGSKMPHIACRLIKVILDRRAENISGNNIRFVFALRSETLEAWDVRSKEITGIDMLATLPSHRKIHIKSPHDEEFIREVATERIKFLRSWSSKSGPHLMTDQLLHKLEERAKIICSYTPLYLRPNNLRHIIHLWRKTLLCSTDEVGKSAYGWMVILYSHLNGQRYYQQSTCGMSNIFLVNSKYRSMNDPVDSQMPGYAKKQTYRTFWLKFFVSHWLLEHDHLIMDDLYKPFEKYERAIFNLCVYSLSENHHGRLLQCDFRNPDTGKIKLNSTKRLGDLLRNDCFFDFSYLSVIVDDPYLVMALPNLPVIKNIFNGPWEYGDDMMFCSNHRKWKEWFDESISKVYAFLCVLESSYNHYEKFQLPDALWFDDDKFERLRENLATQIKEMASNVDIEEEYIEDKMKKYFSQGSAGNSTKSLLKILDDFFKKYAKHCKKYEYFHSHGFPHPNI